MSISGQHWQNSTHIWPIGASSYFTTQSNPHQPKMPALKAAAPSLVSNMAHKFNEHSTELDAACRSGLAIEQHADLWRVFVFNLLFRQAIRHADAVENHKSRRPSLKDDVCDVS